MTAASRLAPRDRLGLRGYGCWGCGGVPHAPGECQDTATFTKQRCACTVDDRPEARKGNGDGR